MPPTRDVIFGIDFSGAGEPGGSIWITEAKPQTNRLQITKCSSAVDRFGLSASPSRDRVYAELRDLIRSHPSGLFGIDFPFSIPEPIMVNHVTSWPEYLEHLTRVFTNRSAENFRASCVGRGTVLPSDTDYLRREIDWRYGGQCPYQHQLVHQTFYGQRDLLAPLITNDEARALPIQDQIASLPWLIEVYPAAILSNSGLYREGYKSHPNSEKRRVRNIDHFRSQRITISTSVADECEDSDDAHDSVTAAIGAFSSLQDDFPEDNIGPDIEGEIFA